MAKILEKKPGSLTWEDKNPAVYYKPILDISVLKKVVLKNSSKHKDKKEVDKCTDSAKLK